MIYTIPAYFPSIAYMANLRKADRVAFYTGGNYQKQTYRNRCEIHGANGVLKLSIPILHQKKGYKQKDWEVQVFQENRWKKEHWKSLEAAYRSSPYFEFYEDDFAPFYQKDIPALMTFNLAILQKIFEVLEWEWKVEVLEELPSEPVATEKLLNAKNGVDPKYFPHYHQVFETKNGFIPNLSTIDLLFNLGPEASTYLEKLTLP